MTLDGATVMVVDDEPELVEIFSIWLKRRGANVLTAPNGADALALLARHPVDAVVSDIRMPVMDGITLVKRIHELQLAIPTVVFVSGFADISPRTLYAMGVVAMITKPLRRNQLVETLELNLRAREDLWLAPPLAPPEKELSLDFQSLEEALLHEHFALGRGGCCIRSAKAVPQCTVDLHLHFTNDALPLDGQGIVRWYDARTGHAGVEFTFLDPASRRWVLDQLRERPTSSFIPACEGAAALTAAASS